MRIDWGDSTNSTNSTTFETFPAKGFTSETLGTSGIGGISVTRQPETLEFIELSESTNERAAIMEYDGGMEKDEAERLAGVMP